MSPDRCDPLNHGIDHGQVRDDWPVLDGAPLTVVRVGVTRNIDQHAVGSDAAVDDLLTQASLSVPDPGSTLTVEPAARSCSVIDDSHMSAHHPCEVSETDAHVEVSRCP